jgi:hypothetical protein
MFRHISSPSSSVKDLSVNNRQRPSLRTERSNLAKLRGSTRPNRLAMSNLRSE